MSGRRVAGIAAAVGLLAASLLLALLAADVLRVDRALAQGDARFGPVAGRGGMWEAETLLPAGLTRRAARRRRRRRVPGGRPALPPRATP